MPFSSAMDAVPLKWKLLADASGLDLTSTDVSKLFGSTSAHLEGELKGVRVEVQAKQVPVRQSEIRLGLPDRTYIGSYDLNVDVCVYYKFGRGPALQLLREGTFRSWLKRFGYQDIELGQTSLDFQLTIKGEQEELIRDVMLANAAELSSYVGARHGALPSSDGSTIQCKADSLSTTEESGPRTVAEIIQLLVGLASTDIAGLKGLLALPGAKEGRDSDGKTVVRVEAPTVVEFYPERLENCARLRVHVPAKDLAPLAATPCSEREQIESHFGVRDLPLGLVRDAELSVDSAGYWLSWPMAVEDAELLMDGAKLLARLAAPVGLGAYR